MGVIYMKHLIENNILEQTKSTIEHLNQHLGTASILLFVCDKSGLVQSDYDNILSAARKPLLGGVFPAIAFEGKTYEQGAVVVGISQSMNTVAVDLSEPTMIQQKITEVTHGTHLPKSVLCWIDAFGSHKTEFVDELYDLFGNSVQYAGGGTGSLDFVPKPCVFTEKGAFTDHAVLGFMEAELEVQIAHGWEPVGQPLKITEIEGNRILSINWRPAFEVYQEELGRNFNQEIAVDGFFDVAKSYPFGILRKDADFVVRDPISTDGKSLLIVDYIPSGEFVYLLNGSKSKLLNGARSIAEKRGHGLKDSKAHLFIDCISRYLYLGADFQEEIGTLDPSAKAFGVLSIGEIANNGSSYLEIYNKTTVMASF
jgi:hypothetical protein